MDPETVSRAAQGNYCWSVSWSESHLHSQKRRRFHLTGQGDCNGWYRGWDETSIDEKRHAQVTGTDIKTLHRHTGK